MLQQPKNYVSPKRLLSGLVNLPSVPRNAAMSQDAATCALPTGGRDAEVRHAIEAATRELSHQQHHLAALLFEVHENGYWRRWGFRSFRQFVNEDCGFGIRKAQQFVEFHRKFVIGLGIPPAELESVGWSKLALVAGVINRDNQDELLETLQRASFREIKRLVQEIRSGESNAGVKVDAPVCVAVGGGAFNACNAMISLRDDPLEKQWLLERPSDTEFFVDGDVWEQLCYAIYDGINVLLTGPSGSGKSELCAFVAQAAGRSLERFNFGAMSEPRASLVGNVHFDPKSGTRFAKSRFVLSIERPGSILLLDELSRAAREAFNILLPLLDGQKYLALDEEEHAAVVHPAEHVCFLAAANIGVEFTGADALDVALRDRFPIHIAMDFPPMDKEIEILINRCPGLTSASATRLVRLAARQREMASEGDFVGMVSTRALLAAGRQLAAGVSLANAFQFCILNHFSADGGDTSERARLQQVFQKDEEF